MKTGWLRFRRFWQDEEVPRWMGLSLVVLYLVGLTTAAVTAVSVVREQSRTSVVQGVAGAATELAEHLTTLGALDNDQDRSACRHALRRFARDFRCSQLRLVDGDRQVLASIHEEEVGSTAPPLDAHGDASDVERTQITALPAKGQGNTSSAVMTANTQLHVLRAPSPVSTGQAEPRQRTLEGVFAVTTPSGLTLANHSGTLAVVLATAVLLFLLYRGMRRHFRAFYHITSSARAVGLGTTEPGGAARLTDELDSLRVADSLGATAQVWNRLIDEVQELHLEVQRGEASDELRRVLEQSSGGKLGDALTALPEAFLYITGGDHIEYANTMALRLLNWDRNEQPPCHPERTDRQPAGQPAGRAARGRPDARPQRAGVRDSQRGH